MRKKVIAAGHICIDITPAMLNGNSCNLEDILVPGKLINVNDANVHTGGSVANTGLAMKKFGLDVSLMGKVGKDAFGGLVQNILKEFDAAEGLVVADSVSTSYSIVLAFPGIDRIFLHNPGANDTFKADDISNAALQKAELLHFGYPPLMESMYREDGRELVALFRRAKEMGVMTSLDLAAVDPGSEAGKSDWDKILRNVLPYVDFFVPSIEELCFMLNRAKFKEWKRSAVGQDITEIIDVESEAKQLAEQCMEYGAKVLLIKCGTPGLYYRTAKQQILDCISDHRRFSEVEWAKKEGFEKSYIPDEVISATGAGDTTIAAFLTAVLNGYSLSSCLHMATAAGAACVTAYDALSGLMSFSELEGKIKAGWKKRN